jgi:hypothetical protein
MADEFHGSRHRNRHQAGAEVRLKCDRSAIHFESHSSSMPYFSDVILIGFEPIFNNWRVLLIAKCSVCNRMIAGFISSEASRNSLVTLIPWQVHLYGDAELADSPAFGSRPALLVPVVLHLRVMQSPLTSSRLKSRRTTFPVCATCLDTFKATKTLSKYSWRCRI